MITLGLIQGDCEFFIFENKTHLAKMDLNYFLTQIQNNYTFIIKSKIIFFLEIWILALKSIFSTATIPPQPPLLLSLSPLSHLVVPPPPLSLPPFHHHRHYHCNLTLPYSPPPPHHRRDHYTAITATIFDASITVVTTIANIPP